MQVADHHKQRDDTAGEQHCENNEFNVNLSGREAVLALGERVRHGNCEKHVDQQSQNHPFHEIRKDFQN